LAVASGRGTDTPTEAGSVSLRRVVISRTAEGVRAMPHFK
jgi:hypothetical protein